MKPLGILLRHGDHEAAHYALVLATGAAAVGRNVTLFATNAGCRLFLANSPLLQDPREALLAERGVATIAILLEAADELGIQRIVCEAGLAAEGLRGAPLAPGVTVAGVITFLAATAEGQMLSL